MVVELFDVTVQQNRWEIQGEFQKNLKIPDLKWVLVDLYLLVNPHILEGVAVNTDSNLHHPPQIHRCHVSQCSQFQLKRLRQLFYEEGTVRLCYELSDTIKAEITLLFFHDSGVFYLFYL